MTSFFVDGTASKCSTSTTSSISDDATPNSDSSQIIGDNFPEDTTEQSYFKCGNKGCSFEATTSTPLKNHLVICDQARQSHKLVCAFCKRLFKQSTSLIDHLRTHGPNRYSCALCEFRASVQSRVSSHMKTNHNVNSTILVPLDSLKQDPDKDSFVVTPKERRSRGIDKNGSKKQSKADGIKTKFCMEEVQEIPNTAIFQFPLGCSLCVYETKVRSNLIRHISQHTTELCVSQEEVVNPVPEKAEKMFDKMMNLAGSSHKKRNSQDEFVSGQAELDCQYKYVPDQERYMCHLKECGYQTVSESMLRFHISVIHKDEAFYLCPHCPETASPVPIDQLGLHLKLHDSPLFKCAYCYYYSHIKRSVEKHQTEIHTQDVTSVQLVRMAKPNQPDGPVIKPLSTDQPDEQGEEWLSCTICSFKTKKKKVMLSHGITEHQMNKPFKCSVCSYESNTDHVFKSHFKTYHPLELTCQFIALYKKVTELKRHNLVPIPPLWKRDNKRIKLIRGIKLDEKGDAPPPVATCVNRDISDLDILELRFGSFGKPAGDGRFQCPRCPTFQVKNRQDMREHLYKDHEYKPFSCVTCKIAGTQKAKILKHINKTHNIDWKESDRFIEINNNKDIEDWVEKVLSTQQEIMKELAVEEELSKPSIAKKKRRLSIEGAAEIQKAPATVARTGNEAVPMDSSPALADSAPSTSYIPAKTSSTAVSDTTDNSQIRSPSSGEKDDFKPSEDKKKRSKSPSEHRFGCNYCGVTAKFKQSIVLHIKKNHPNMPPQIVALAKSAIDKKTSFTTFICTQCSCTAFNLRGARHHWMTTHETSGLNFKIKKTITNYEFEYECFWCKKRSDIHSLEDHCKVEHPDQHCFFTTVMVPKYKCSRCSLVLNSVDILKRHFSMDHPSEQFCYVVVNTHKLASSGDKNARPSGVHQELRQSKQSMKYKCCNCHFVSPMYWSMVKHINRHYVTYVCTECDKVYSNSFGIRSHICNTHPGSEVKPLILKGSERDIKLAKSNIIIISQSGKKRRITEEEILLAEIENDSDQSLEMYSYDEQLEMKMSPPNIKETARKSTGSSKQRSLSSSQTNHDFSHQTQRLPKEYKQVVTCERKGNYVNIHSNGKIIKLPLDTLNSITNFGSKFILVDVSVPNT